MTRQRIRILCLAALLLAARPWFPLLPAQTAEKRHPIDMRLDECLKKDPSTAGMLECLGKAYTSWDAELNAIYKKLLASLPAEGQNALRESQRAWLKYRDQEFLLLEKLYGLMEGSMYQTMQAADRVDFVRKRALELSSYLDVLEK
jgi:uncharacterized protein YecT (DUF1311 family)